MPDGHIPVRFLDDNSWTYVLPKEMADFVEEYDIIYAQGMPKGEKLKQKYDRAVIAGRQLTAMEGWVQCESCEKWRQYPCTILKLRDDWVCSMNTWDAHSSCAIPEQKAAGNDDDFESEPAEKKQRMARPIMYEAEDEGVYFIEFSRKCKLQPADGTAILRSPRPRAVAPRATCGLPV